MPIRIWQAYSCNNSSSARMVARFVDAATAKAAGVELDGFFKAYAAEMDALLEANDYTWPDRWPPGATAFANKHGFKLDRSPISWGDEGMTGDEPQVIVEDDVLLVFHDYCGGGFGKGVASFLQRRGGRVEEDNDSPNLSVMFAYAGGRKKLDADLAALFSQVDEESREVEPLDTPWKGRECYGTAAFYRDAKSVAMVFPFDPRDLTKIRAWLTKHGIAKPAIWISERTDGDRFAALVGATCEACAAPLELWHPRLRDVETEQMVCTSCGGMYEPATVITAATKRRKARERAEARAAKQAAEASAAAEAAKQARVTAKKAVAKPTKTAAKKPAKKPAKQAAKKRPAKKR